MALATVPEIINNFNVYTEGDRLVGVSGEVTLPNFEAITETISGAGLLGEYDAVNVGQFSAQDLEIPFRLLEGDIYKVFGSGTTRLTLRGAIQVSKTDGDKEQKGMRIIVVGQPKNLTGGKLAAGKPMEASATIALTYIKIEVDGSTMVELDKLNSVFVINGSDLLQTIRSLC